MTKTSQILNYLTLNKNRFRQEYHIVRIGVIGSFARFNHRPFMPDIDWSRIKAFRNILAHNYFGIDADEVWQIIHQHLPDLEIKLKTLSQH